MDRPDRSTQTQETAAGAEGTTLINTQMEVDESAGRAGMKSALEGKWRVVDATISGAAAPQIIGQRLKFSGHRFQITKDGELRHGGTFGLEPAASPPAIEFHQNETDRLAGVWLGIYEMKGDKLTICDNAPDMEQPRPKGFGDGAKAGYVVVQFRRES